MCADRRIERDAVLIELHATYLCDSTNLSEQRTAGGVLGKAA